MNKAINYVKTILWSILKIILRLITRKCEIERILEKSQISNQELEYSIINSKQLSVNHKNNSKGYINNK
jgi:hypothetical protein